ncbi:hypothetical protein ACFYSF_22670 [Streptomyces canus]|uniref:hypothetical protein n=1 Tax=Streptomyces canus TaxID=58343 RepID=UPI003689F41C
MTDIPDPQQQPQPRVPGVRYRTETRKRPVPSSVFGEEVMDEEEYEVDVPIPHRDWDRVLMRFLLTVALASTVVTFVWSTSSISKLLRLIGTETEIAIGAASLFELLWIVCLAAEWLLRRQPARAKPMKAAGWVAVWFVVAAVVAQGVHAHEVAAGVFGGLVSLMAKGSWWVVFRVRRVDLRRPLAVWLQRKMEDASAVEELLSFKHSIGGRQAYAALVFGDDEFAAATAAVQAANRVHEIPSGPRPDPSGQPSRPVVQPAPAPVAQSAAPVPPVPAAQPQAQTQQPAPAAPQAAPAAPAAAPSGQASAPTPPAPGIPPSIASTVRSVLAHQPGISDEDLIEEVKKVHGDRPKLADTVLRNRRKKAS